MDRKKDWKWLPAHMPGVARLVAEKRKALGDAHVDECWRRGVMQCEPGWFFAREGPLTVGTPDTSDPTMLDFCASSITSRQAVVMLRQPASANGGGNGA